MGSQADGRREFTSISGTYQDRSNQDTRLNADADEIAVGLLSSRGQHTRPRTRSCVLSPERPVHRTGDENAYAPRIASVYVRSTFI